MENLRGGWGWDFDVEGRRSSESQRSDWSQAERRGSWEGDRVGRGSVRVDMVF